MHQTPVGECFWKLFFDNVSVLVYTEYRNFTTRLMMFNKFLKFKSMNLQWSILGAPASRGNIFGQVDLPRIPQVIPCIYKIDHLSQSLDFLWIHSYFLASTFYNSSHSALWHFFYHCHALLLMFHIFILLSPRLNFKFLEGVYTSRYSSYCLDFNKFAI